MVMVPARRTLVRQPSPFQTDPSEETISSAPAFDWSKSPERDKLVSNYGEDAIALAEKNNKDALRTKAASDIVSAILSSLKSKRA